MNDFQKQLNKHTAGIKLSATEKRDLKSQIVSYMEYHPRREQVAIQKAEAYLASQPYTVLSFHNRYLQGFVGIFAVFIFIAVPTMAERAVPGDVLYPIKVKVNEEVRSTLTLSATQKIEWETERLERRISEVRLLASEGKLTQAVEDEAVAAVKAHAEAAQDGINKLRDSDADEASFAEVAFESALEVQSLVLDTDHSPNASTTASDVSDGLAGVVREVQATAVAAKSTTTPSYQKITARLESETTRAYELFASLSDVVSPSEKKEIERRLSDIERAIAKEQLSLEVAEENPLAPQALIGVLADIRKLISFMTDIDVQNSVDIESIVPMSLTDEERYVLIEKVRDQAMSVIASFENARAEGMISEDMLEKAGIARDRIKVELETLPSVNDTTDAVDSVGETDVTEEELMRYEASVATINEYLSAVERALETVEMDEEEVSETVIETEISTSTLEAVIDGDITSTTTATSTKSSTTTSASDE